MNIHRITILICILVRSAVAGESALTTTYQPLDGLGSGRIAIVPVTCHHWYSHSASSAVDLIATRNVPPTDNPAEAHKDLNLASVCGVKFTTSDLGAQGVTPMITMDASGFILPKRFAHPKEEIIRASLECLRLCIPEKLRTTPVTLKCKDADKEWISKIVSEFNVQPRTKVFYVASP